VADNIERKYNRAHLPDKQQVIHKPDGKNYLRDTEKRSYGGINQRRLAYFPEVYGFYKSRG
jgi:hypothetical protein